MPAFAKVAWMITLLWACAEARRNTNEVGFSDADTSASKDYVLQQDDPVKIEDSNMAKIGSEADKERRQKEAELEPAFEGVGQAPGLWVWRMEQFKVVPWKKKDYGKFYKGDCYLVLKTKKDEGSDKLIHTIFFWLGSASTKDEQGTAAYKSVQLDDLFGGAPTQSREVEGSESRAFSKLFPTMQYLEGGVESGFNPADPTAYKTKLFLVRKTKKNGLKILEVPPSASSMNQGDCFVLDGGQDIRSWCGNKASPHERFAAGNFGEKIEAERLRTKHTSEHGDPSDTFWEILGGKGEIKEEFEEELLKQKPYGEGVLYQMSHIGGKLELKEIAKGDLKKDMLVSSDVMLVDTSAEIFVWVGKGADTMERRNAMDTAIEYLKANNMPLTTPVHLFKEGSTISNKEWNTIFSD